MSLVTFVEDVKTLDESVQSFYKEVEGGGFILDAEPVNGYAVENVVGLQTALKSERKLAKEFEKNYKALQTKWDGMDDPEEIKASLVKLNELSQFDVATEAEKIAAEKFEANKKKFESTINKSWEAREQKLKSDFEPIKLKYDTVVKQLEKELVTSVAVKALLEEKGRANLLMPHIRGNIKLSQDESGAFNTAVVDEEGEQRFNSKGLPMSVQELVASFKTIFPEAFDSTAKSGGGAMQSKAAIQQVDVSKLSAKDLVSLGMQNRKS